MRCLPILVVLTVLAACERPASRTDQAFSATGRTIAMSGGAGGPGNACFACHGLDGGGDGVSTPRLAGLETGYLHKQMEDYASGLRADAVMTPVARALDDQTRRAVSAYYAQLPVSGEGEGEAGPWPPLWTQGDPARGLQPCAACHGDRGQGVGLAGPALSGQPRAYAREQMERWRLAKRRNDPRGVMGDIARKLTVAEVDVLATWLSRRPASPGPATDAASASGAWEAAGRSAASRAGRRLDR